MRISIAMSCRGAVRTAGLAIITMLPLAGASYAHGQKKPVLHTSILQPSSTPEGEAPVPSLHRTMMQTNLKAVNTGSGIVYTCDPSVAASTCTYLNTTIAGYYNSVFTNANANIYVTFGSTGLGSSSYYFNFVSYSQYVTALGAIPQKSAIQTSAQSALSTYDATPYGAGQVWIQASLGAALGFTGMAGTTSAGAFCTLPSAGCYNGVITITNDPGTTLYYDDQGGTEPAGAYDFYAVVEHETDEVLGTSSCVSTQGASLSNACDTGGSASTGTPSAVDLFRYSSAGNLVLNSSLSTTPGAYFSYDGGSTNGTKGVGGSPKFYNTLSNFDDYADYVASSPSCATNQAIQDATGCPGADAGITILNDGGSEVNILTAIGYGVPANNTACTSGNPNPNPNPAAFAVPGDFNGDCKSDVLWRNSNSQLVYTWLMNGFSVASQGPASNPPSPWVIQGAGDFDGNGMSDILWRNTSTGEVYLWLMNGSSIASQASLGVVPTSWVIQGVGDFNGDGKSDILWRNSTSGLVYLWLMNGTSIASQASVSSATADWVINYIGDFNGDGKADILWRNSTSGMVYVWLMNGTTIASQGSPMTVSADWVIQGAGDFNGDGKSDILWRNSTSGEVYVWLMNGISIVGQGSVFTLTADWTINGIGDYNGDGKSDILWRNSTSGQVYTWLMNGNAISSQSSVANVTTDWQISPILAP
jgi:hypothetical protein